MQIILASQNKNKLKELSTIFQINSSKHSLVSPSGVLNVIEDKATIKENAEKKALEYFEFYDLPVIADDSGLFVDALNGAPGVHSARFSGEDANDEKNNDKLLDLLQNNSNRSSQKNPDLRDLTVKKVMTSNPVSVNTDMLAAKALSLMNSKKITSLCVHSKKNKKNFCSRSKRI